MNNDRGYVLFGWALRFPDTALPAAQRAALGAAIAGVGDGWALIAHGTDASSDALSVRLGVVVAAAELDAASAGMADEGFTAGDETLMEAVTFDGAAITRAKKQLRAGRDAALGCVRALGLGVYDEAKPGVWLLVTGGQTRAVLFDAAGKRYACSAEGDPRPIKLPAGAHRLVAF